MAVTVSSPVWRRGRNNLRDQERKDNLTERNYLSEIDFLLNQPVRSESPSYLDSRLLSDFTDSGSAFMSVISDIFRHD